MSKQTDVAWFHTHFPVAWWSTLALPKDLSPVIIPPLVKFGLVKKI